jgi:hypothetical protein
VRDCGLCDETKEAAGCGGLRSIPVSSLRSAEIGIMFFPVSSSTATRHSGSAGVRLWMISLEIGGPNYHFVSKTGR